MSVILTWDNASPSAESVSIYRSDTVFDPKNPGTALQTVAGNIHTFTDSTAVNGAHYSYGVGAYKDSKFAYSDPFSVSAVRCRGPGGQTILQGDARLGYMGPVAISDMPDFMPLLGATTIQKNIFAKAVFHKFIRKNKIYYVYQTPLYAGVSTLTAKVANMTIGLDSGINWGFPTGAWTNSGKNTTISHNGSNFYIRSPRGFSDDWNGADIDPNLALDPTTEYNEIVQPVFASNYIANRLGSVVPYSTAFQSTISVCAEQSPTGLAMVRGATYIAASDGNNAVAGTLSNYVRVPAPQPWDATVSQGIAFWPILVLQETA